MTSARIISLGAVVTGLLLGLPAAAGHTQTTPTKEAAPARSNAGIVAVKTRLAATATVSNPQGLTLPLKLELRDWHLSGRGKIELPEHGFYLASLVAGEIVTIIGSNSDWRHPGDFWSVGEGQSMVIRIRGQSAILKTFAVNPAPYPAGR